MLPFIETLNFRWVKILHGSDLKERSRLQGDALDGDGDWINGGSLDVGRRNGGRLNGGKMK
jgi:hypothetical protein